MNKTLSYILGLALLCGASSVRAAAPETITTACGDTYVSTGPTTTDLGAVQHAGIYDLCNPGKTCPESEPPPPPPSNHITFQQTTFSCAGYSLGASAKWQTFGLNASYAGSNATCTVLTIDKWLIGWCQCDSMDVAKRHFKDTVNVTMTCGHGAWHQAFCLSCLWNASWTEQLDRWTLSTRSPADPHQTAGTNCLTSCP